MKLQARTAALLEAVETYRESGCRGHLEPARARARTLLTEARRAARGRVHAAIAEERAAFSAQVTRAQARLATRERMAHQHLLQVLLAEGGRELAGALAARWRLPASRREWIETALARALATLPRSVWTVTGPGGWPRDERDAAAAWLEAHGVTASVAVEPDIEAGVRVVTGGVELDATLAGLLADRRAVEGRLLHMLGEATP